ncbi:MAG: hypothetical protein B7X02_00595, partial [Rhodospirillales bacterium 12-54-5]
MGRPLPTRGTFLYLLLATAGGPLAAFANPVGGVVNGGVADISNAGSTTTITQTTSRAVIDWQGFDIGAAETTRFVQPDANAIALNRIHSAAPSQIDGRLSANGNLILVNPNGVVFGSGSHVDVNRLVATTSNIANDAFMSGKFTFDQPGNPGATIENRGTITAKDAGLVGLVAPNVINSGTISANLGHVQLSSGDSFTLDLYGDGLFSIAASDALQHQLVRNTGTINANGGRIDLTAAAARGQVDSLIEVDGELNANAVGAKDGKIYLFGEGAHATTKPIATRTGHSTVQVSGRVNAKSATGRGGNITITADRVGITKGAVIDASGATGGGVVAIGGDLHGGAHVTPTTIEQETLAAVKNQLGPSPTPNALYTVVQSGAIIQANATDSGHGGLVSVWADERTVFDGTINANGGVNGGDGGMVETSGKAILQVHGLVNAVGGGSNQYELDTSSGNLIQTRRKGKAGEWLLDPADITINGSGSNAADIVSSGTNPITYQANDNDATSYVGASVINAQLQAGTSVIINTGAVAGGGNGDITVATAISGMGGSSGGGLTLSAYRNIIINASITLNAGNLLLQADNAGNNSGYININANISTNGGNITAGGGSGVISAGTGYATGNSGSVWGVRVQTGVTVAASGGSIIMNAIGANTTAGSGYGLNIGTASIISTTGTGTITLRGTGNSSASGGSNVGLRITGIVSAANGNITIIGSGGGSGSSNHGVWVNASNITTTGTGSIFISGTGSANGSSNHGIAFQTAGTITTSGGGSVTLAGVAGTGGGGIYYVDTASLVTTTNTAGTAGNITLLADTFTLSAAGNVVSGGTLTIAPLTSASAFSIGSSVASSVNFSTTYLGYVTGGAYVFGLGTSTVVGSTGATAGATGAVTVNTTNNFGSKNVTFINGTSASDITMSGAYTATAGGALTLSSYRNIIISSAITLGTTAVTGGALLLQTDNANAVTGNGSGSGYININANISTFGGNITAG